MWRPPGFLAATLLGPKPERREHGLERPIYCSNKLLRTHTLIASCSWHSLVIAVGCAASVSVPSATRISIFVLACPSVDPFHQCSTSSAPHFAKFHAAFVSPLNGASPPPVAVSRVTLRRYVFFFVICVTFSSREHPNGPSALKCCWFGGQVVSRSRAYK